MGTFVYLDSSTDIRTGQTRQALSRVRLENLHVWSFVLASNIHPTFDPRYVHMYFYKNLMHVCMYTLVCTVYIVYTFRAKIRFFLAVCQLEGGCVATSPTQTMFASHKG